MDYRDCFESFVKKENIQIFDKLSDVVKNAGLEIKKGDYIKVRNGYGIVIGPFEVLGFRKPDYRGACIYLNWDCYWFTEKVSDVVSIESEQRE